jgi:hypothetical protein
MISTQDKVHQWNANLLSFHSISVESNTFIGARVQLAGTLRLHGGRPNPSIRYLENS